MQAGTIGTHVVRPSVSDGHMNASSVRFSSARKQTKASHGVVHTIAPDTRTGEDRAQYNRRMNSNRYLQERQQRRHVLGIAIAVVVAVVIVVAAIAAGVAAYLGSTSSSIALEDSDAKSALTAVSDASKTPYYVLIDAELGSTSQPLENVGPDLLELVRIDEANGKVTLVNIPPELQISSGYTVKCISETAADGDAALVDAVKDLTGVKIAHFVKLDQDELVSLVDKLGGVSLSLSEEIDDPNAGDIYIPKGDRTLSGQEALVYLRATNVANSLEGRMQHQNEFTAQVLQALSSNSGKISFAQRLDALNGTFHTDLSSNDLIAINDKLAGTSADDMVQATLPGYIDQPDKVVSGQTYYVASTSKVSAMMEQIDDDGTVPSGISVGSADPSSFTVAVQNGTTITGAAAAVGNTLTGAGFKVESTGNADQAIYNETLVVYDNDNGQAQAQAVINALGFGRAVKGQGYYEYDTDILVMIGADYKPTS